MGLGPCVGGSLRTGGDVTSDDAGEGRHAHVHSRVAASNEVVELDEFLLGAGEADQESFDFIEPAFALGLGDAGEEVVADLDEPCPLGGVWSQE